MEYDNKADMLTHLSEYINKKLSGKNAEHVNEFAGHYFSLVAFEDIQDRQSEDLYGALLSHWNLALNYQTGSAKINVYNPVFEEHGWQSAHTVIEIVIEDMPFLVQSIVMEINRHGYANHQVIHAVYKVLRSKKGDLQSISSGANDGENTECMVHIEIDRLSTVGQIELLQHDLGIILCDVRAATQDWELCLAKMKDAIADLQRQKNKDTDHIESIQFLQWVKEEHFVFLGYREYKIVHQQGKLGFSRVPKTGLGVLTDAIADNTEDSFSALSADTYASINSKKPIVITKGTRKATVHRPVFMDYIGIKQYDQKGQLIGEKRFLGLYSSAAYACSLNQIPMVSDKINRLLDRSQFQRKTHAARALLFVLQSLPRDELFQADDNSLMACAIGVLKLQERQRVRVFVRHDVFEHFVSLIIFVPRERYHTQSRQKIQEILLDIFDGQNVDFSVQLSESILARIHFVIHSSKSCCIEYQVKDIEKRIIEILAEWKDDLKRELQNHYGEAVGNEYLQAYSDGFSAAYREDISARTALLDLKRFEEMLERGISPLGLLYSPLTAAEKKNLHFKLYCSGQQASLSKGLPMLENMGVKVLNEKPY